MRAFLHRLGLHRWVYFDGEPQFADEPDSFRHHLRRCTICDRTQWLLVYGAVGTGVRESWQDGRQP